ncbi:D-3-phosphoglycerate dehydrogenase [Litoreibacter ascidiaceicola]|uniref:D-3-phosphoglycerate dehydrogenase n=1 Tax=Litoreibacter ascidiaceicola TaxID=1486859 RepID=A0A1M5DEL8_9RHOB|nr:C-terminal binding protein [Litoreibacter ascidiaceicola]SHF65365.1 D-3-phosphoglycerate dehydrogenase [Litoreibacter ascidiaceicola]SHF67914.1 D-3-phosphoglycerate dehydrogenase [Litoreibacter ascidiaceicola]
MTRVVLLDNVLADLSAERHAAEKHGAELLVLSDASIEEAVDAALGAQILLSQGAHFPVTRKMIEGLNEGGYILKYGAGYDKVDVAAATEHGIRVANLPDGTTEEVAEHTSAMVGFLLRRLGEFDKSIRTGAWNPSLDRAAIPLFSETVVGFVGFGRIAQAAYRKMSSFGFQFAAYDPHLDPSSVPPDVRMVALEELAEISTVISLHLAATPQTTGMIDASLLKRLGPTGFLVNTSRGAIVNEEDLVAALHDGTIAGAALDAFCVEPLPADSPLRTAPNLLLTPHAAFYSQGSDKRVQRLVAEELERALTGQALRCPIA